MSSYQSIVNRITDIIYDNSSDGQSYILIGDNSSGKSEILRNVVSRMLDHREVYFVDSVNRTFDAQKVLFESKSYINSRFDSRKVVEERIHPFNFNLQDTFKATTSIEQLYDKYCKRVMDLCKKIIKKDIRIVRENSDVGIAENSVKIDDCEAVLSSGYQAILRIFCEVLFFCDTIEETKVDNGLVVIDEIDEYLSPKYSAQILNFLQEQFPQMSFLVTTHSLDLVERSSKANLIILRESSFNIYTTEELKNVVSAEDIFATLFFDDTLVHKSNDDEVDKKLRVLLNLKIAGLWDEKAQNELNRIAQNEMHSHQKMICKQIEEW